MPDQPKDPASTRIVTGGDEIMFAKDMAKTTRNLFYEAAGMVATAHGTDGSVS
jgi:hypothetical protein